MNVHPLQCHPATPVPGIDSVSVHVQRLPTGELTCRYVVTGEIDTLHVPARKRARHVDGLWEDTCFEVLVRVPDMAGYVEVNASPSREWALYRFDGYRSGMRALSTTTPPRIECRYSAATLRLDLALDPGAIGATAHVSLQLGVAAVLRLRSGAMSYWGLVHAHQQPDFHHPDGFVLTLDRTEA